MLDVQATRPMPRQRLQSVDFMAVEQKVGFDNPWELIDADLGAVARAW